MPGNHRGNTADGTFHLGVRQTIAGVALLSTGLSQGSLCFKQGIAHGLYRHVANDQAFLQALLVFVVHACRGEFGLGAPAGGDSHL